MKYDDSLIDNEAQENFLLGLHKTAISEEEYLMQQSIGAKGRNESQVEKDFAEAAIKQNTGRLIEEIMPIAEIEPIEEVKPIEKTTSIEGIKSNEDVKLDEKRSFETVEIAKDLQYNDFKITYIKENDTAVIYVEEDVLVPDVQQDLEKILLMDAKVRLAEKEYKIGESKENSLKINGEILLKTIYVPLGPDGKKGFSGISSRLPFSSEKTIKLSSNSKVCIKARIKKAEYTVINERKFRVKIAIGLDIKEYTAGNFKFFEGIEGEKLQTLKENFTATDVIEQKCDFSEMKEDLLLPEGSLTPEKVLDYSVTMIENHRQISDHKAVVNGTMYCTVLYMTCEGPKYYQGAPEITRFVPLTAEKAEGCSRICFDTSDLEIKILTEALDEDGEKRIGFSVEGSLGTQIELFKQTGGQIVTDVYHEEKTLLFDHANTEIMTVCGCGSGDTSIREIMNIPDNLGEINEIVYGIWNIENIETDIEPGKGVVSGFAKFKLLCQIGEEEKEYYVAEQQVPFRVSMEIVGVNENMELSADVQLKNVWFDKINGKQAEVNGGISVSAIVYEQREYETIENPAFLMCESDEKNIPSIVLYIVKPGDSLWKIAKLFKTTVDAIKDVNELESDMIMAGSKLLIVR